MIYRNVTSVKNILEYKHCVFADLDAFPRMQRAGSESPSDYRKRKYMVYSHDCEMIFALPSLQLQLRTTHQQAEQEPVDDGIFYNRIHIVGFV